MLWSFCVLILCGAAGGGVSAMTEVAPLALTLLAYELGLRLQRRFPGYALLNPVFVAVVCVTAVVRMGGVDAAQYAAGTRPLALLLAPATMALAVPLQRALAALRPIFWPVLTSVATGLAAATLSAVLIAQALHTPVPIQRAMLGKSVTAAMSLLIARQVGADPSLAVGVTVLTGTLGSVVGLRLLDWARVRDPRARGLAMGVSAHAIGTARVLSAEPVAGGFAGFGLGLASVLGGLAIPAVARVLWPG